MGFAPLPRASPLHAGLRRMRRWWRRRCDGSGLCTVARPHSKFGRVRVPSMSCEAGSDRATSGLASGGGDHSARDRNDPRGHWFETQRQYEYDTTEHRQ
eukprot:699669-Prymnesium_polylepis.2